MLRRLALVCLLFIFCVAARATDDPVDCVEAQVDNPAPYAGQPVLFTWRWFIATTGGANDSTRVQLPDFAGFGQEAQPVSDPQSQLINGRQYQVLTQQIV